MHMLNLSDTLTFERKVGMKSLLLLALFFTTTVMATPREAYQELEDGKAVFIDVREKDEIKAGMIKGAKWIPLSEMEASTADTVSRVREVSDEKTIYVYCRTGRRSGMFLDKMKANGLSGRNLGGYQDLIQAGLPSH